MFEIKPKTVLRGIALTAAAALLSACGQAATPVPTPDMSAYSTAAVLTVEARYTQTAAVVPTETPVPTYTPFSLDEPEDFYDEFDAEEEFFSGDFSPETVYYTSEGDTGMSDPYVAVPTASAENEGVNSAVWQSQTPADNTHISPGADFVITWNLLNTGTTTWTTDYSLRFYTGTNLSKPGKRYTLSSPVPPNTVGACSMEASAPWQPGTYQMSVVLGTEEDVNFAIVDITIVVD